MRRPTDCGREGLIEFLPRTVKDSPLPASAPEQGAEAASESRNRLEHSASTRLARATELVLLGSQRSRQDFDRLCNADTVENQQIASKHCVLDPNIQQRSGAAR